MKIKHNIKTDIHGNKKEYKLPKIVEDYEELQSLVQHRKGFKTLRRKVIEIRNKEKALLNSIGSCKDALFPDENFKKPTKVFF